jgi:hypothetical protein
VVGQCPTWVRLGICFRQDSRATKDLSFFMPLSLLPCSALHQHKELGNTTLSKALQFMDQISIPAGRVQSPSEVQGEYLTRQEQQEGDALDTRIDQAQTEGKTRHLTNSGDAGIAPHFTPGQHLNTDCALGPSANASGAGEAAISTFDPDTKSPRSPTIGPGSLATTAVSTPERQRHFFPTPEPESSGSNTIMLFLIALAKLAAFTVSFAALKGLHCCC